MRLVHVLAHLNVDSLTYVIGSCEAIRATEVALDSGSARWLPRRN